MFTIRRLAATGLLFFCALAQAAPLDGIVAVVNQDVVLASELRRELDNVKAQLAQRGVSVPREEVLRQQVLERLVMQTLQLAAAERAGIRVDDSSLNAAVQRVAEQNNMSLSEFRAALDAEGIKYTDFREGLRREILLNRLQQRQIQNQVNVAPQEIEEFLKTRSAAGTSEYLLGHILIATPEAASPEQIQAARAKAEQLVKELDQGAEFGTLAASHSQGQNALEGGSLGWRSEEQLPSLFAQTVPKLDVGEVAGPIQSPSGLHLVKLVDKRDTDRQVVTQTRARHILIRPNEVVSDKDARMRLESLRQRIEGGADFASLAQANSNDKGSAADGGSLGWVTPGVLVPEFQEVMDELEPGELSSPFKSRYGWHIVQVLDRREHDNTEEMRRARAAEIIRERKAGEALENWLRQLREEAYVDVRLDS